MSIEALNNQNENLFQENLYELKNQIIQWQQKDKEKKESKKVPWKFEYIWNKKDKEGRSWKFYSYTFVQWGTLEWVINKRTGTHDLSFDNFCDKDWNKTKKEKFKKWETVYIKIPNIDIINPTPEMNSDEIMWLSKEKLHQIYSSYDRMITHQDKNWFYIIINKKKLYFTAGKDLQNNRTYIDINAGEGDNYISIWKKNWNKIMWVYLDDVGNIYKWNLKYENGSLQPKK